jgi:1-acyl-sn-glycerol-3-phosphate acyltransferase
VEKPLPQTRIPQWRIGLLRAFVNLLFTILTRRRVAGLENIPAEGGCVLVFNHVSNIDPPLFFGLIKRPKLTALLASNYRERPFHRFWIEAAGGLWIRRGQSDRAALAAALTLLEQGWIVGLAPEGTRSPTGGLREAKRGAAFLAARAGVPVLPVGVTGTGTLMRSLKRLRRPMVTVTFGKPFRLPAPNGRDQKQQLQAATDEMMCRVAALLPPGYRGVYADRLRTSELMEPGTATH